jgi:bifunctional non-homologous end joining protein LigD
MPCSTADENGRADFDRLHSRCFEHEAVACAFDLLRLDGDDMRRLPLSERKAALSKLLRKSGGGIQYVAHCTLEGEEAFAAACELGIEGIVSKRLTAPYKSGPCKSWINVKSEVAGLSEDYRWHVLMAETDIEKALAMLEYAAARRGLFLTVHALNKAKEVLKWELLGDRAMAVRGGEPLTHSARSFVDE